jgi:SAM-dependent methyltransferase
MPENDSHPDEVDMSNFFVLPKQELQLSDFDNKGEWILDIGGGGEGIIGILKGREVVAIDRIKRELEETKNESLKIVMDVKQLQFMDASFSYATAFFTFMYIPEADFETVLSEVWRVLKPGGEIMIWEPIFMIPPEEREKRLAVILLKIHFPDGSFIDTGYGGVHRDQDIETIIHPASKIGFVVTEKKIDEYIFYVKLQKPQDEKKRS